jgi:hypothetical protein
MKPLFTHFVQQTPQGGNKSKMKKEKKTESMNLFTIINLDLDGIDSEPNF